MQFSWVSKGLRTGVLTTRYPAVAASMPAGFRGRLVLSPAECRAAPPCSACAAVCLPRALTFDSPNGHRPGHLRLDLGACIGCGLCVAECPAGALAFSTDFELAAMQAEDLWSTLTFETEQSGDEQ